MDTWEKLPHNQHKARASSTSEAFFVIFFSLSTIKPVFFRWTCNISNQKWSKTHSKLWLCYVFYGKRRNRTIAISIKILKRIKRMWCRQNEHSTEKSARESEREREKPTLTNGYNSCNREKYEIYAPVDFNFHLFPQWVSVRSITYDCHKHTFYRSLTHTLQHKSSTKRCKTKVKSLYLMRV